MAVQRRHHTLKVTPFIIILLMMFLVSVSAGEENSQTNLPPSNALLGAGARWAARNGTTALYVNFKDNWSAHHLTDGADWYWFTEIEMDNWRSSVTNALTQSGFEVTLTGDIPENLDSYDLVVIQAYYACEPRHAELIRNYVSNGGGLVLIYGTPMYFVVDCKDLWPGNLDGSNLASIQEWLGCGRFVNVGGTVTPAFDNPLGTSFSKSDVIITTQSLSAAYSSLSADAEAIALWSSGFWSSGGTFAFTHEYGAGRVYCQGTLKTDYETSDSTPSPDSVDISTSISIAADVPSMFVGFTVEVSGVLSDAYGNALCNETVLLYYTFPEYGSWIPITSDTTNEFGEYDINWIPSATGSFTLKAEWKGNATHSGSSAFLSLSTAPYKNERVFSVASNSTVSAFAFNSTSLELSFRVSGLDGSTGYVELTVAKSIVADVADIRVFLDGRELAYSASSSGDSWLLVFTYAHSTHDVAISFGVQSEPATTEPLLMGWVSAALIASAAAVSSGLVAYILRRRKKK